MSKRLVVCCDGTWNLADQPSKTNVTKVALAVKERAADGTEQLVYYHSGVGTRRLERLRGGAFGWGLSLNVVDAYRFLVQNFEPGDELFLFGFSRGAFTARSLAGFVHNCGILKAKNADRVRQAWALYRDRVEKPTGAASTLFRRAYAHETDIHFVGVWDTVGALGIPVPGPRLLRPLVSRFNRRWAFHDTTLSSKVKAAFHALAIDEQRSAFEPTLWHQQEGAGPEQTLRQVWFAGVHCDVGGGYQETGLSDITLLWMVHHAGAHGLEFDTGVLGPSGPRETELDRYIDFSVRPRAMSMPHTSRTGLYRIFPPLHRPIGKAATDGRPDGHECLSSTARQLHDGDFRYRPPELVRYLGTPQQPCVEQVHLELEPPPDSATTLPAVPAAPPSVDGPPFLTNS